MIIEYTLLFTEQLSYEAVKAGRSVVSVVPSKEVEAKIYEKLSSLDPSSDQDDSIINK